jgi:excinuclease UvrABC nuclease subunit
MNHKPYMQIEAFQRAREGVYITYTDRRDCLYVGKSGNPLQRLAQHKGEPWYDEVRHITIEPVPRYEVADWERELIKMLRPRYNVQHNTPMPELTADEPDAVVLVEFADVGDLIVPLHWEAGA